MAGPVSMPRQYYLRRKKITTQQHVRLQSIYSMIDYFEFRPDRGSFFYVEEEQCTPILSKTKRVKYGLSLSTDNGAKDNKDPKPAAKKRNQTRTYLKAPITTSGVDFFNSLSDESHSFHSIDDNEEEINNGVINDIDNDNNEEQVPYMPIIESMEWKAFKKGDHK